MFAVAVRSYQRPFTYYVQAEYPYEPAVQTQPLLTLKE